jgi:hypothetical protein
MKEDSELAGAVRARGLTNLLRQGKVPSAAQVEAAAMEIFSRDPISIAPANKLLCCALLCAVDWLEKFLAVHPDAAQILGHNHPAPGGRDFWSLVRRAAAGKLGAGAAAGNSRRGTCHGPLQHLQQGRRG